jgi:predicted nucleotidyltransferase
MASKTSIKTKDKTTIRKFAVLLRKQGIRVSKMILFGSHAKGNAAKDSDIDIAIISRQFGRDAIKEMMLLRRLAMQIDSHIEPIPLSPAGLTDPYSTFSYEIRTYGIAVN